MESDQLIRPRVFMGGFSAYRTLDREVRDVADLDLADYLILSRATLTPAGAPVRLLPRYLCLAPDLVAAKAAHLMDEGFLTSIRDRDDRRAFSLVATDQGTALYELITAALGLRLRVIWKSLPETVLEGVLDALAAISGVGTEIGGYDGRAYTTALVLQAYVHTCASVVHGFRITSAACGVLLLLGDAIAGGAHSSGFPLEELNSRLKLARTTSIPTLAVLESNGLVEPVPYDIEDGTPRVRLTSRGQALHAELVPALLKALAESPLKLDDQTAAALATVVALARD